MGLRVFRLEGEVKAQKGQIRLRLMRSCKRRIQFLGDLQLARCLFELAVGLQYRREVVVSPGIFRIPRQCCRKLAHRAGPIAGILCQSPEFKVRFRESWGQLDGLAHCQLEMIRFHVRTRARPPDGPSVRRVGRRPVWRHVETRAPSGKEWPCQLSSRFSVERESE